MEKKQKELWKMGRCFTVATESKEAANMEDIFYFLNGNYTSINKLLRN